MTQKDLADFGGGTPRGNDPEAASSGPRLDVLGYEMMDDDAEPDNTWSCPWCCAPPRKFVARAHAITGCGNCGAMIPVGAEDVADWYARGEKIV